MKIAEGSVVTLDYDITTVTGEIVESSSITGPITFVHGQSGLIRGLDAKLLGMQTGDEATFEFPPEDAFGRVEDAPKRPIPLREFPSGAAPQVGAEFEANTPEGQTIRLRIVEVGDDAVIAAMEHPLAGQTIGMSVTIVSVRDATRAERESGRVVSQPPPPPSSRRSG